MIKVFRLNIFDIVVTVGNNGSGTISSNLKHYTATKESHEIEDEIKESLRWNANCDAIESIILGHACSGVNIEAPEYVEGIVTAIEAMYNHQ